jgi:hypothetical protein
VKLGSGIVTRQLDITSVIVNRASRHLLNARLRPRPFSCLRPACRTHDFGLDQWLERCLESVRRPEAGADRAGLRFACGHRVFLRPRRDSLTSSWCGQGAGVVRLKIRKEDHGRRRPTILGGDSQPQAAFSPVVELRPRRRRYPHARDGDRRKQESRARPTGLRLCPFAFNQGRVGEPGSP